MNSVRPPGVAVSLAGQTALVTGGSGGLGAAIGRILVCAGARVLSVDLPGTEAPAGTESWPCDLADPAAIEALGARLADSHPRLEILVHCAGITRDGVVWKLTQEDWAAVLRVNLDSAFHLLHAVVPRLRDAERARVVMVSSINGQRGKFGQANYAASKAGLLGLTKSVARELGSFGIRVNAIAPGMIRTAMTADLPESVVQTAVDETALGCLGDPDDVAGAVLFLCSPLSNHVTGQVLRVDGGQCMA